jgi:cytochrome c-type biogenesis protein
MFISLGLAGLAGLLTTLSPCVLPLLPIVLVSASGEHRLGPLVLACGLALSYVSIGLFVATIGFSIGLGGNTLRAVAAIFLLGFGVVLLTPMLQARMALAAAPLGQWADARFGGSPRTGLMGQFGLGVLLGAVWSPCVGPTLGSALLLASQSKNLFIAGLTMLLFAIGAAVPLILLGMLSRETMMRWRTGLMQASHVLKVALGLSLVAISIAVLTGLDRSLETVLVDASPQWLTELTTRF